MCFFSKGFAGQDDGINETTRCKMRMPSWPNQGSVMPVNRSSKPLIRMARRHCAEWKSVERGIDRSFGIPLVTIQGESREAMQNRARLLAADPAYPPPYVVNAVAELMARHVHI
jgi:hypothetical protein